jgi:hypothetical protein
MLILAEKMVRLLAASSAVDLSTSSIGAVVILFRRRRVILVQHMYPDSIALN